ncbi:FKBP-type peptidyl-prolyl cis-trans isomerase [Ruminococcaceae bacterium OttesenSCG-928-A11]|nr:FKBP-type peptidyl-prolyl cis-trans isomerase [Ruminococcaceae bacterium OttesenSCG-928-A11]
MKFWKLALSIVLVLALSAIVLISCGDADSGSLSGGDLSVPESLGGDSSTADAPEPAAPSFYYSDGLDENGYWEGVTALDYVELFDYDALTIPADSHTITDDAVQGQIDSLLANYTTSEAVTDRAVADGDTFNIDYVGSVDGVEFEGGTTGGAGTEVTIGVTTYIDDFLEQLVGHMPGETFNVEVTFPEDYGQDHLNGKDAVFVTTINHVVETVQPELTDAFVAENLAEEHEWITVEEMRAGVKANLQRNAIVEYIRGYLVSDVAVSSVPEQLITYQENALVGYYEEYAAMYGVALEDFLTSYMETTLEDLIASNHDYNVEAATYYLVMQALAESMEIVPTEENVANYFAEHMDSPDYAEYETEYGLPYLKQTALCQLVLDRIIDHAVLA